MLNALGSGVLGAVGEVPDRRCAHLGRGLDADDDPADRADDLVDGVLEGHPRDVRQSAPALLDPTVSTWGFGVVSIALAVPLILISETVLELAVVALGFPVCFYYGTTGFACAWYYRREIFRSVRKFVLVGLAPLVGGLMFYGIGGYAIYYYGKKATPKANRSPASRCRCGSASAA